MVMFVVIVFVILSTIILKVAYMRQDLDRNNDFKLGKYRKNKNEKSSYVNQYRISFLP